MAFRADEHSRQHVESIERANNWVIAQFNEILSQRAKGCTATQAVIDGSFLIPAITQLFYLYSVASQPPLHLPDDLIQLGVDDRPKSQVKAKLVKAYAENLDYGGRRFPEVYVLRFCSRRQGCVENSMRPVFNALYKLDLLQEMTSEYTGVTDCEFRDTLLKIVDDYYVMQRFNPKMPRR